MPKLRHISTYLFGELSEKAQLFAMDNYRAEAIFGQHRPIYVHLAEVAACLGISIDMENVKVGNGSDTLVRYCIWHTHLGKEEKGLELSGSCTFAGEWEALPPAANGERYSSFRDALHDYRHGDSILYIPIVDHIARTLDDLRLASISPDEASEGEVPRAEIRWSGDVPDIDDMQIRTNILYEGDADKLRATLRGFSVWMYFVLREEYKDFLSDKRVREALISEGTEFTHKGQVFVAPE